MFGKRADGWLVKDIDPIVSMSPYFMPMRCDAQVMLEHELDYESLARYIVRKGEEGYKISFMDIIIAAYVRTIAEIPMLNRFIANKRIYTRNELCVSFVVLQNLPDGTQEENTVKVKYDPHDTIFDVAARNQKEIKGASVGQANNNTLKIVKLLKSPIVANFAVGLARLLDRYGLIPKILLDASPFHTGMFFTNVASIGLPAVKHHIYNFGTTSLFVSMGSNVRRLEMGKGGKIKRSRKIPLGIVADERICPGLAYSKVLAHFFECMKEPERLELPPEQVRFDEGHTYAAPGVKIKKRRFRRFLRLVKLRSSKSDNDDISPMVG